MSVAWGEVDPLDIRILAAEPRRVRGLSRLEIRTLAYLLTQRRVPARQIAELLEVDPRTVYRWRAEDRAGHTTHGYPLPTYPLTDVEEAA